MKYTRSGICFLLFVVTSAAAAQNPTTYPYGGVPDKSRQKILLLGTTEWQKRASLNLSTADFRYAKFDSTADFSEATFASTADFSEATFASTAHFSYATFDSTAYFYSATFNSTAGFLEAQSEDYVDFENAEIRGPVLFGSHRPFKVDLTLAIFLPQAKVELQHFVDLKMPVHKFEKLTLLDTLSYTRKESIIEYLKNKSYADNKAAAFELDYILAQSTMYQEKKDTYEKNQWYHPKWLLSSLYYWTMGFGYRPFWLIWWALGIVTIGILLFFKMMGQRINVYVATNFDKSANAGEKELSLKRFETFLNCAYFSVMLFFTFRLKGNLLTFFDAREKKYIVTEWLLGLAVYVAFLYHTSSVLQNVRSLFVGG